MGIHILDNPLVRHKLSILRDEATDTRLFREITKQLAAFLYYEAARHSKLDEYGITTPIAKTAGYRLSHGVTFVPVLRAGLGMLDGCLDVFPEATVGHVGLYRDPDTLTPVHYYCKLPDDLDGRDVFVLDPMCATGGSAVDAVTLMKENGARSIKLLSIISSVKGIEAVASAHQDVDVFTCAVDGELNSHGYIVPGLGDAGDRLYGTI